MRTFTREQWKKTPKGYKLVKRVNGKIQRYVLANSPQGTTLEPVIVK